MDFRIGLDYHTVWSCCTEDAADAEDCEDCEDTAGWV